MNYLKRLTAPRVSRWWQVLVFLWWSTSYGFDDWFKYVLYAVAGITFIQWLWEARKPDADRGNA